MLFKNVLFVDSNDEIIIDFEWEFFLTPHDLYEIIVIFFKNSNWFYIPKKAVNWNFGCHLLVDFYWCTVENVGVILYENIMINMICITQFFFKYLIIV